MIFLKQRKVSDDWNIVDFDPSMTIFDFNAEDELDSAMTAEMVNEPTDQ